MKRLGRTLAATGLAVALVGSVSACATFEEITGIRFVANPDEASPSATVDEVFFDSEFTRDGTYESHETIDDVDFVLTMWPSKVTPLTNEWYPSGDKYFSFTFQAYDLSRDFDDKFSTKRKVYLKEVRVNTDTVTTSGTVEHPLEIEGSAKKLTWDPEPLSSKRGILITNPKGSFELRKQVIGDLDQTTIGVNVEYEFDVYIQRSKKSKKYDEETIEVTVPVRIFTSTGKTYTQEADEDSA